MAGEIGGGRYQLLEPLGGGGTSIVHRAAPVRGGPPVAVKLLRPQFAADASIRKSFLREAELARQLDHPAIVRVLEVGQDDDAPFIVLELVRAETLRQALARLGPFPPSVARAIFAALASALDHAHQRGVLHRDVKPENVFVAESLVKLGDFGNARVVSLASVTGASLTWGTPEYVAPELFARGRADPRSDLYALGVIFYEMLTGRLPWTRSEALTRVAAATSTRTALPPTDAGEAIDRLIADLLSPDPTGRPATGAEALARLDTPATAIAVRKSACSRCGAPRPDDVPRCLACGVPALRLHHTPGGRWRVVLDRLADDASATETLFRALEPLVKPRHVPLTLLTGNRALYSEEERKAGVSLPAVLLAGLDEPTARAVADLCRAAGLETRVLHGTVDALDPPPATGPNILAFSLQAGLGAGAGVAGIAGHMWYGLGAGALFFVLSQLLFTRIRARKLRAARGLLELRDELASTPVAEALLAGAATDVARVRAPEVRALYGEVTIELYRLTQRAEALRAAPAEAPRDGSLIERTIAAASSLLPRLRDMAARLDALDDALAAGSEGELMQRLARLDRAAGAAGADLRAIAGTRREVEATLARRAAAEQERARLSALLCRLLGNLREVCRRALALEALDEGTASAVEAAAAELDALLSRP